MKKLQRRVVWLLNRRGGRQILGWLASAYGSWRIRKRFRVYPQGNLWFHHGPNGFFIVPGRISLPRPTRFLTPSGKWKPHEALPMPKKGDIVMDIGAATGRFTLALWNLVGATGRVIAVEASPSNHRCMEMLRELNEANNITLEQCAIVDKESEIFIEDSTEDFTRNSIFGDQGVAVRGRAVDDLVADLALDRIDCLWMNIEGAERLAIKGMAETLRKTRYVAIGCHDFRAERDNIDQMRTKRPVLEFLKNNGFKTTSNPSNGKSPNDWVFGENTALVNAVQPPY